jgi:hypothetical protein
MKTTILILTLFLSASTFAQPTFPDYAPCPKDGEDAPRVSIAQINSDSCPVMLDGSVLNAAQATYSHNHIAAPLLEKHTFYITKCLR